MYVCMFVYSARVLTLFISSLVSWHLAQFERWIFFVVVVF